MNLNHLVLIMENPPLVIASCITTVFNEVSTVTSPSAPLKPECSAVVPLLN